MAKTVEISFNQILDFVRNADSYRTAREIVKQGGFTEVKTKELLAIVDKTAVSRGMEGTVKAEQKGAPERPGRRE